MVSLFYVYKEKKGIKLHLFDSLNDNVLQDGKLKGVPATKVQFA